MGDSRPIGIFDSGVGGLTVAVEIHRLLPSEKIIYLGDLLHLPYGSKSSRAVLEFTRAAASFLVKRNIKLLVIACNTATSIALDNISRELSIPVIGVIKPGVIHACNVSKNKRIGVIGTTRTIESRAYENTIHGMEPEAFVFQKATPLLVPLIEEGWIGHRVVRLVLEEYLSDFMAVGIDTLVLGCTHYPLIIKEIGEILPDVNVVDSASTTAGMTREILKEKFLLFKGEDENHSYAFETKRGSFSIYLTDFSENFTRLAGMILGTDIPAPEIISLNYNRGKLEYEF